MLLVVAGFTFFLWKRRQRRLRARIPLAHLPELFVVFDLETTGLDVTKHNIIEIGAIRVHRDATNHETFQSLVKLTDKVPKKIIGLTGITQEMVDRDGNTLDEAIQGLSEFVGDLRLISFNAEFDMAFLNAAAIKCGRQPFSNPVSCALQMARRAWPGRKSYRLADIAKGGNLASTDAHRALVDCQRALTVYGAAASILRSVS